MKVHLKSFILKNLLDGDHDAGVAEFRLVDDPEAAIADDLCVGVRDLLRMIGSGAGRRNDDRHFASILACIVHCTTHRKNRKTIMLQYSESKRKEGLRREK